MTVRRADVFVSFGISGDLAKQMTFPSLYRLEQRGLLHCPIVGVAVDDWSTARLHRQMHASIRAREGTVDRAVFDRLTARCSYLAGDFADPATYRRLGEAIAGHRVPVFYLQTPPSLFAPVVAGLAAASLVRNARVVIEKPFGHDLASAKALAAELHRSIDEAQIFRVDHFLGKLGVEELLYLRFANQILEPVWSNDHVASIQITMAEQFGVEDRGRFYDRVGALRDVVVNHLLQVVAATTMDSPTRQGKLDAARHTLLRSVDDADPARYVRGQYQTYHATAGVAARSSTETYAALELRIASDRWAGVPIFIRTGKHLPVTRTEVRLVFRDAAPLTFLSHDNIPTPNELAVAIDPAAGVSITLEAHRANRQGPGPIGLQMDFADQGGDGPTPYENLFEAALHDDHSLFTRQNTVEECWRVVQPLLGARKQTHRYRRGTWGPKSADRLTERYGGWRTPGTS